MRRCRTSWSDPTTAAGSSSSSGRLNLASPPSDKSLPPLLCLRPPKLAGAGLDAVKSLRNENISSPAWMLRRSRGWLANCRHRPLVPPRPPAGVPQCTSSASRQACVRWNSRAGLFLKWPAAMTRYVPRGPDSLCWLGAMAATGGLRRKNKCHYVAKAALDRHPPGQQCGGAAYACQQVIADEDPPAYYRTLQESRGATAISVSPFAPDLGECRPSSASTTHQAFIIT